MFTSRHCTRRLLDYGNVHWLFPSVGCSSACWLVFLNITRHVFCTGVYLSLNEFKTRCFMKQPINFQHRLNVRLRHLSRNLLFSVYIGRTWSSERLLFVIACLVCSYCSTAYTQTRIPTISTLPPFVQG